MENTKKSLLPFVLAAGAIYAISITLRANSGVLIEPIAALTGQSYANVSFIIALGLLIFGISQPLFGVLALKTSNRLVLLTGILAMGAGFALTPFVSTYGLLVGVLGILAPLGTGALSFGILMGAISGNLSPRQSATASGLVNASSGIGSSIMAPLMTYTINLWGITVTMVGFAAVLLLLIPAVLFISKDSATTTKKHENVDWIPHLKNRDFILLTLAFVTCGFHMSIIQTHLIAQMQSYGLSNSTASYIYTIYGLAILVGAVVAGYLCSCFLPKNILAGLYGIRAITDLVFVLILPKTLISMVVFAILLGLTGDATVTPTSEIITRKFGAQTLAILFGIAFIGHQIGGFISSWAGGILISTSQNYTTIWLIDTILCALAALISYFISKQDKQQ